MSVETPLRASEVAPAPRAARTDRPGARAAGIALLAWTALVLVYGMAVLTPVGQLVDTQWMTEVAAAGLSEAEWADGVLDLVSAGTVLLGTAAVTIIALARRGAGAAAVVLSVVLVTIVGAQLLKVGLPRPSYLFGEMANSLPSGHVAAVAGLAVAAWLAVGAAVRPLAALLGTAAVAVTGLATVVETWHRPSDVVAAVLLAVAVGASGAAVLGVRGR